MRENIPDIPKTVMLITIIVWVKHVLLLIAGLIGASILSGSESVPDLALFFGRFHPMVLHFPVSVLASLLLLEIIALFKGSKGLSLARYVLLALGTHTAVVAAVLGLFLATGGGYDPETLFWHKWLGVAVAAMALLASGLKIAIIKGSFSLKPVYIGILIFSNICLMFAGHEGANLTHGKTYLFKYAPDWIADLAGYGKDKKKEDSPSAEDTFTTKILPILEEKCFKCHAEEKQKGDYRLDNYADLMKTGESEIEPVVPYVPAASYLVELITLASDADEVMPPDGKGELTDAEIMTIIRWVANGANGPKK